ncbi:MAG: ATP synthase F1 subunit delta [Spirochaetes bacterium]|nr:ATP synthase F1 subunit delta [Spirochaetota bacterium]
MAVNEVSRVYAKALLEIGKENNILPRIEDELNLLCELVNEDADFRSFCETPNISAEAKKNFVEKVFRNTFCNEIVNFLKVLIDNNRLNEIRTINEAFHYILDEESGRMRVTVTGIDKFDAKVIEKIKEVLSKKFKKEIVIEEKIDKSILGGIIIRIGDLIIDGSILKDLNNIRRNLLSSKIRREMAYED